MTKNIANNWIEDNGLVGNMIVGWFDGDEHKEHVIVFVESKWGNNSLELTLKQLLLN